MKNQSFEGIFDRTVEYAKENFLRDGSSIQTVLLGWDTEDGAITCVVAFGEYDDNVRNILPEIFKKAIQKLTDEESEANSQPNWYIQQTEAWMVQIDMENISPEEMEEMKKGFPSSPENQPRPADHPDRKEVLMVHGKRKDGESKIWSAEILREPNLHLNETSTKELENLKSRVEVILWGEKDFPEEDLESSMDHLKKSATRAIAQLGGNPTDKKLMRMGAGWIKATVNSDLGNELPPEIKQGLLRAAVLMEEKEGVPS